MQSEDEVVLVRAVDDGSICVFTSFRIAEGYVEATDVIDGQWGTFYRLSGEILTPEVDEYGWVVRLLPTGTFDHEGLVSELAAYAERMQLDSDGTDPPGFVNEIWSIEWAARWPKWPRWLDRRMHGDAPQHL